MTTLYPGKIENSDLSQYYKTRSYLMTTQYPCKNENNDLLQDYYNKILSYTYEKHDKNSMVTMRVSVDDFLKYVSPEHLSDVYANGFNDLYDRILYSLPTDYENNKNARYKLLNVQFHTDTETHVTYVESNWQSIKQYHGIHLTHTYNPHNLPHDSNESDDDSDDDSEEELVVVSHN